MASPEPELAVTLAIRRFRTITLLTDFRDRPQPVSPEAEPTPAMVLFEATLMSPVQVKDPDTLTISAPDRAASVVSPARDVTVTVAPPAPPVVVPAIVAYPSGPDDTADGAAAAAVTPVAGPAAAAGPGAGLVDRAVAAVAAVAAAVAVKAVPVETVVDGGGRGRGDGTGSVWGAGGVPGHRGGGGACAHGDGGRHWQGQPPTRSGGVTPLDRAVAGAGGGPGHGGGPLVGLVVSPDRSPDRRPGLPASGDEIPAPVRGNLTGPPVD